VKDEKCLGERKADSRENNRPSTEAKTSYYFLLHVLKPMESLSFSRAGP
jgi:hypothetical protein